MHLKYMEDSIEIRPPGSNPVLIVFRVESTRENISFVRFNGALLDLRHGSAIEGVVSDLGVVSVSVNFNPRFQLFNRLGYKSTQPMRLAAVQSPVKGSTDISTVQP